jgi:transcriptional regulator with XRE-family HTH domain
MDLRERLAALRRDHHLTLKQLRDRIEERTGERLSVSYLSAIERSASAPPIETLARIGAAYGLSIRQVLQPVEASTTDFQPMLPESLKPLVDSGEIQMQEAFELAEIQFRGRRPQNPNDWRLLWQALRAATRSPDDE